MSELRKSAALPFSPLREKVGAMARRKTGVLDGDCPMAPDRGDALP